MDRVLVYVMRSEREGRSKRRRGESVRMLGREKFNTTGDTREMMAGKSGNTKKNYLFKLNLIPKHARLSPETYCFPDGNN